MTRTHLSKSRDEHNSILCPFSQSSCSGLFSLTVSTSVVNNIISLYQCNNVVCHQILWPFDNTPYLPNTFPDVHTKPMARDTFLHWTIHVLVMCEIRPFRKIELRRCCTDTMIYCETIPLCCSYWQYLFIQHSVYTISSLEKVILFVYNHQSGKC